MPNKKYQFTIQDQKWLRNIRMNMLSRPLCRRMTVRPNPKIEGPFDTPRAPQKTRITPRTEFLAQPKKEPADCEANYFPVVPHESWYRKTAVLSRRQIELAQPKHYADTDEIIEKTYFKSKEKWQAYQKKLKTFAAPKRTPPSPTEPVRAKTPLKVILPHLKKLAKPAYRPPNMNEWTDEELFIARASAMRYIPTERILKLATPKRLRDEALMDLNWSSDERKRYTRATIYKASDRIIKLSTPLVKNGGNLGETKQDPYKVNPKALKYVATKRIKKLAIPRKRD